MLNLLVVILLAYSPVNPKTQECKCAKVFKDTLTWCTGPRGGIYCITDKGTKRYKPKF